MGAGNLLLFLGIILSCCNGFAFADTTTRKVVQRNRKIIVAKAANEDNAVVKSSKQNVPSPSQPASDENGSSKALLDAISLVAGTTVGAGILALPSSAQEAGFIPSSAALLGSWVFMSTTGLLIAEVCCNLVKKDKSLENIGILSMVDKTLGRFGAVSAGGVYIFIHYALLVAYIAQAGGVLTDAVHLPQWSGPILFTSVVGSVLAFGSSQLVSSFNNAFVVLVIASFVSLVALGAPSMDLNNLLYQNYGNVIKTIPIMLVALVYHNIVPSICAQLNYNKKSIRTAITAGSFIPLLMFLTWNAVILGIIGTTTGDASSSSLEGFDPVQVLRTGGAGGPTGALVSIFSEAAIITSFVGFVIGLMDFYADVFRGKSRRDLSLYSLVLLPPLGIAIASPNIFAGALDYAGTFGISILFGAIPALMAYKLRSTSTSTSSTNNIGLDALAGSGTAQSFNNGPNNVKTTTPISTAYETFVPGGSITLLAVFLGAAAVIGQKLFASG